MDQTSQDCFNLTGFQLDGHSSAMVTRYCRHFGRNISELTFVFQRLATDSVVAILQHRTTLKESEGLLMSLLVWTSGADEVCKGGEG
jgi:hypothetical protein